MRVALTAAVVLALAGCNPLQSHSDEQSHGNDPVSTTNTPASASSAKAQTHTMQTGGVLPARSVADAQPDFKGLGPLRFGMTVNEMRKAWGAPLHGDAPPNDAKACYYLRPRKENYDLLFMVEGGRFVRGDVKTDSKAAPGGGRVGMRIDQLRKLYDGRIKPSPNFYDATATDLRVSPPRGESTLLVFEADRSGKVTSWRIGFTQQVNYVEGCS